MRTVLALGPERFAPWGVLTPPMPSARLPAVLVALAAACAVAPPSAQAGVRAPSPFAWRGVVEGAYGPAWTIPQRTRMLEWLAPNGFNAYIHAPKSDAYSSRLWRTPYPADQQQEFDDEIASARAAGVQWIPNLSPARPAPGDPARICLSCPDDLAAAVAKFTPFLQAGAQTVMVSFDDVAEQLSRPEDVAAYGGTGPGAFGRANADFLDRLLDGLRAVSPAVQLLAVPADYAGTADTPYLQGLRAAPLRPEVQMLWTGPTVRSSDFTRDDAAAFAGLTGRTPIVWENWLNNDFTASRLFLGPYGRTHDLAGAVGGFFFNPMNAADLNRLPLATAGAWMRDPARYAPRKAWLQAVGALAGPRRGLADELRAWAETSFSTSLGTDEAPTFSARAKAFLDAYRLRRDWSAPQAALDGELQLVERAARDLRRLPDASVAPQAAKFLSAARQGAGAGRAAVMLLAAERPVVSAWSTPRGAIAGAVTPAEPARADAFRSLLQMQLGALPRSRWLYGCRGAGLGCPPGAYNSMDAFISQALALDAAWSAQADVVSTPVRLFVNGTRVPLRAGRFALRATNCGRPLVAIDAGGGRTIGRTPACPRPAPKRARRAR